MVKITGTRSYIDVELNGKVARIPGEMIVGGFVAYKRGLTNWYKPNNVSLTETEKQELIYAVTKKTAGSHMVITFE